MNKIFTLVLNLLLLSITANAQSYYKVIRAKLPMSNEAKDYYVKQIGTNYVLNGDIIVGSTLQQLAIYQSNNSDGAYIWPKGFVPVVIDGNMKTNRTQNEFGNRVLYENAVEAIKALNNNTNVRIVPYTNEKDYIRIKYTTDTGYGGVSPIGKRGGEQIIYITSQSGVKTIVHELLHSLGFWHEQSRYDRNNYVDIDTTNVQQKHRHNFQIEPGSPTTAYDYESIMHYPAMAFAIDKTKPTIRCKKNGVVSNCTFGSSYIFSENDIKGINAAYWFNKDIGRIDYSTRLPLDDYFQQIKKWPSTTKSANADIAITKAVDKPLAAGIYSIKIQSSGKYLEVTGAAMANGTVLQQWDKTGAENQKFEVTPAGKDLYYIKAVHSGRYLNVIGQSTEEMAGICQWDFVNQDNLKFYLSYNTASNGYMIKGLQSGLNWFVFQPGNGTPIVQTKRTGDYFIFERIGNIPSAVQPGDKMKMTAPVKNSSIIKKQ